MDKMGNCFSENYTLFEDWSPCCARQKKEGYEIKDNKVYFRSNTIGGSRKTQVKDVDIQTFAECNAGEIARDAHSFYFRGVKYPRN